MKRYSEFKPTRFDSHIRLDSLEDWLVVPCARNRDSECADESNFAVALEMLGGEGDNVEVHRFGHWANGWFELILVRPGSAAEKVAAEIEESLENYPLLSDDDYSERERVRADEVWESCYRIKDRIAYIRENREQFEFASFSELMACVRGKYFAGYASELLA